MPANVFGVQSDHAYSTKKKYTSTPSKLKRNVHSIPPLSPVLGSSLDSSTFFDDEKDPDYTATFEKSNEDSISTRHTEDKPSMVKRRKFVVFEDQLDELFKLIRCTTCGASKQYEKRLVLGTSLHNSITCMNGHIIVNWKSQPLLGKLPAFNLLLCTSIFCSGKKE